MKTKSSLILIAVLALASLQLGMSRSGQYDEEARAEERRAKQLRKMEKNSGSAAGRFAGGVKQATYDNTADLLSETAEGTVDTPVLGTLEGARKGSEKVFDNTVKGAVKVATLGLGEVDRYEVQEPERGSDDTGKITFKIPGT